MYKMNLQSLPVEIIQLIAKHGGEKIENLKYSNRYFYELFLDSHMKEEIKSIPQVPRFPFEKWETQKFFIECFRNRKFKRLVDFFNEENPFMYKDTMLNLCIHFMSREDLDGVLSRIKIPIDRCETIESTISHDKKSFLTLNYIKEEYSHLFDKSYFFLTLDCLIIDENCTIGKLNRSLMKDLKYSKRNLDRKEKDSTTKYEEKISKFLTKDQNDSCTNLYMNIQLMLTFFFINGNKLKQVFDEEEIEFLNKIIETFDSQYRFIISNYCPIEAFKDLLQNTSFLSISNVVDFSSCLVTLNEERIKLIIDRIESFRDYHFTLYNLYIVHNSIKYFSDFYKNFDVLLYKVDKLTSHLSFETIKDILFFDLSETFTTIEDVKFILYLLIKYVTLNENIQEELYEDFLSILNARIERASELNMRDLVSYVFDLAGWP